MFAAALLGSGVANAETTLYASQYGTPGYPNSTIRIGDIQTYNKLVVDTPLTLIGGFGFLDLYNGATLAFSKVNGAESICSIFTSAERSDAGRTVVFEQVYDVYNFTFDAGAEAVVAASTGTPITLIQDLNTQGRGFSSNDSVTLQLNGKVSGETVEMGGLQFTYVGPKADDYVFQTGEIGFTGYYGGSHNLSLVHGGGLPTPEPTTGSLSLLALAGLCIRRRK